MNITSYPLDKAKMRVTSPFCVRIHPITKVKTMHNGIDYGVPQGSPVYAVADGKVVISKMQANRKGYGEYIVLLHDNGGYSLYAHLSKRIALYGNHVKAGDKIALSGNTGDSTGAHLHFGLCEEYNTRNVSESSWIDPQPYIDDLEDEMVTIIDMKGTDGKVQKIESINKDGYNFIKLRDIPKLIPGIEVLYNKMPQVTKIKEK